MKKILIVTLTIALAFAFFGCDKEETHQHEWEWVETTPATPTADGLETETCKTCGAESGNTRIIEQTEPTNKGPFPLSFNFANPAAVEAIRNTNIQDERTNCGSQNLEQLGIKTLIEQAILGAFNNEATTNGERARFRNVFGDGITIYVNNPVTLYKIKALDGNTIYFHIDYLKSSPADIQKNIFDLLGIMNDARSSAKGA